jgi:hypothetical protein
MKDVFQYRHGLRAENLFNYYVTGSKWPCNIQTRIHVSFLVCMYLVPFTNLETEILRLLGKILR